MRPARSPRADSAIGSPEPSRHPRDRLKRELSFLDATMLVVSSVIGVGIFLTPGSIGELLPAPGWMLAAWLVGGALSLAGALANAELAYQPVARVAVMVDRVHASPQRSSRRRNRSVPTTR